ncbi:hypothetical protein KEM55_000360, partial [Ascosphaera atra]
EKGYSARDKRVTEQEFNKRMEIEAQMAADRERAAAMERQKEEEETFRRKKEIEGGSSSVGVGVKTGSAVRKPVKKVGGGSAVVRPMKKRGPRGF